MHRVVLAAAALLCAALAGCSGAAKSGDVIYVYSNTADGKTSRFAPPGAWDLQYSWSCARAQSERLPGAKGIDLVVYNSDDNTTAFEHPESQSGAAQGKGVLHFQRSGDYYVGFQTRCDWDVAVIDRSG